MIFSKFANLCKIRFGLKSNYIPLNKNFEKMISMFYLSSFTAKLFILSKMLLSYSSVKV